MECLMIAHFMLYEYVVPCLQDIPIRDDILT